MSYFPFLKTLAKGLKTFTQIASPYLFSYLLGTFIFPPCIILPTLPFGLVVSACIIFAARAVAMVCALWPSRHRSACSSLSKLLRVKGGGPLGGLCPRLRATAAPQGWTCYNEYIDIATVLRSSNIATMHVRKFLKSEFYKHALLCVCLFSRNFEVQTIYYIRLDEFKQRSLNNQHILQTCPIEDQNLDSYTK